MKRIVACAAAALAAVAVQAQNGISPSKTEKVIGPYIKDLSKQNPRIQNDFGPVIFQPENPKIEFPPGEPNNLSVGLPTSKSSGYENHPKWPGIGQTQYVPPDCDMGVGPNNVILSVNSAFAVFDKKGNKLVQTDMTSFWAPIEHGSFVFDPCCFYDRSTGRWFVCADDLGTNQCQELFAVSKTSDPTGQWYVYGINSALTQGSNSYWMDYPHFGITKDAIAFAGNMFGFTSGYAGCDIITVPVQALINGGTPNASYFTGLPYGTTQPARSFDPTDTTMYALSVEDGSHLRLDAITNAGTSPKLFSTLVTIPTMSAPTTNAVAPNDSQGQAHYLDGFAYDGRLFECKKRNGHLVAAHNVSGSNSRIACRWYDIAANNYPSGTPTLYQAGNIPGGAGFDAFQPAVAMTSNGAIGIVYSKSGLTLAPQLDFVSRTQYDPLGTVGAPTVVANSLGSTYGGPGVNRWGDYFGIDVDPFDDRTVWVHGMCGNDSGGWQTFCNGYLIGTFTQVGPATTIVKQIGLSSSGTVANISAIDSLYFQIGSVQVGSVGQEAAAIITFNKPKLNGTVVSAHLDYDVAGPITASNFIYLYNWTTNAWDYFGVKPLTPSPELKGSVQLTMAQLAHYQNPTTGVVEAMLKAVSPQHFGSGPQPFTYKVNMAQFNREEY